MFFFGFGAISLNIVILTVNFCPKILTNVKLSDLIHYLFFYFIGVGIISSDFKLEN